MGQRVAAIVYGVFLDDTQERPLRDSNGEWISAFPKESGRVEDDVDNGKSVLGIAVAVQNVPEGDEDDWPSQYLGDIFTMYPDADVRNRWGALEKWASKLGVDLGVPTLLVTEIERA